MRVSTIHAFAAAAIAAMGFAGAPAMAADDAFRVGGVIALSGPYGVIGDGMRKGAELAAEMRGGMVLGKPIVFDWQDTETKPQVAVQKATKLIGDGADMLFGAVSSGSTLAIMKLVERRKVPLIATLSASDDITGAQGNAWTFRTSNPVDMENRMMAEFAGQSGVKRVYGVVADYAVGRQMWTSLEAKLKAKGVEIVGADYPPLGNVDYSIIVDKLSKSDADGLALVMTGGDAITFLKQSGQVGLKDDKAVFGTMIMDEMMGGAVGDSSYNVNSTLRYHFRGESPANKVFVEAYLEKYGEFPGQFAGEAFDGMTWFLDVVEKTGTWDKQAWIEAMSGSTHENSVEGVKHMRACDNQAAQVGLFGKAVKGAEPYPAVTMEITHTFAPDLLFDPCS